MRCLVLLSAVLPLFAQPASRTETYTYDANGRRVLDSRQTSATGGSERQILNLNGRMAPVEKVEEKVLREDSQGKVVERTIRSFDSDGRPQPPRRVRITESKQPGGVTRTETETFEANINGSFVLSEKREATAKVSGTTTNVETRVERPTLNGNLETVEKISSNSTKSGAKTNEDTVTYLRSASGSFYAAVREVKETEKRGDRTIETAATYRGLTPGQMELAGQTVTETGKRADGTEVTEVNVYGTVAPGRPSSGGPVLREQQIIEKSAISGGSKETFSIRRPPVDGSGTLGPVQKISEKVCSGPCK